jgi:hypothetical protein
MAHNPSCGSAGGGNFQSAIALNAQPGNIINTPSAADGDILVFVEDTDHTDCNGRGAYLNFKPLVFDLRSNTGNKYIDMGVSHAGGATPIILWLHKISSSELSYFSTSQHGTNYMGESTHTEGFLGINTHANTNDQNPYAHLHIYSKLGPSLFMESAATIGTHKDPSFWMKNPQNESNGSTSLSGFSVYAQRPNLIHSFEQANSEDVPFKPDLNTTSIFQMWKRDMIETGSNEDPAISIGRLGSGQNATINDIGTYMTTEPGSFNILTKRPSLLLRSSTSDGTLTWGVDGTTPGNAPHIRMMSRRYNYIHMSGQNTEPGSSTTPGSTVLLSDGTNRTLHIYINDSTTFTSNEMMRFDASGDTVTIYPKLHVEDLSYFKKTADFDSDAEINTQSNINLNHQNSKLTIKPGSVAGAKVEFGTDSDKIPLYLQGFQGSDERNIIVNVAGKPEWQQFSSGMKTTMLERGKITAGNYNANHGWTNRHALAYRRYRNVAWWNKYGDWQTRGSYNGVPNQGNPNKWFGAYGEPDGWSKPSAYPNGTAWLMLQPWRQGGYFGGDSAAYSLVEINNFYPAGYDLGQEATGSPLLLPGDYDPGTDYPQAHIYFKTAAWGDGRCKAAYWYTYSIWFVQEDPDAD